MLYLYFYIIYPPEHTHYVQFVAPYWALFEGGRWYASVGNTHGLCVLLYHVLCVHDLFRGLGG